MEKNNPRDVEADTQPTPTEESKVEKITPEQVLRRSSRSIRSPDRYSPSLHYLLLINEALQVEDSIKWEKSMDDEYILLTNMGEPEGYDEVMLD